MGDLSAGADRTMAGRHPKRGLMTDRRVHLNRVPPAVHGISGNFYLDVATGEAVAMTGPELLRSRKLLAEFTEGGARVVSIFGYALNGTEAAR